MILINDTWYDVKTEQDLTEIISKYISPDVAKVFETINCTWKSRYEELNYDYQQLQEEYDSLECEYDDLQSTVDNLEEELGKKRISTDAYDEGYDAAITELEIYKERPMVDEYVVDECIFWLRRNAKSVVE